MTPEEILRQIDATSARVNALHRKIADAARAIVPVLLDAQRANSAKELQELFFELDALEQSLAKIFETDKEAALAALALAMGRK